METQDGFDDDDDDDDDDDNAAGQVISTRRTKSGTTIHHSVPVGWDDLLLNTCSLASKKTGFQSPKTPVTTNHPASCLHRRAFSNTSLSTWDQSQAHRCGGFETRSAHTGSACGIQIHWWQIVNCHSGEADDLMMEVWEIDCINWMLICVAICS